MPPKQDVSRHKCEEKTAESLNDDGDELDAHESNLPIQRKPKRVHSLDNEVPAEDEIDEKQVQKKSEGRMNLTASAALSSSSSSAPLAAEMTESNDDELCQACAKIDLFSLFTGSRSDSIMLVEVGTLRDVLNNRKCPLCRLIRRLIKDDEAK